MIVFRSNGALLNAVASILSRRQAVLWTRLVTVITGLALSACAATGSAGPEAPEWLAVDSVPGPDGCPDLAGLYENRPSAAYPGSLADAATLTDIFGAMARGVTTRERGRSWTVPGDARLVSVEQGPEDLTLTFIGNNSERTSQNFHRLRIFRRDSRLDETFVCNSSQGIARMAFPMAPLKQQTDSAAPLYIGSSDVHVQFFRARDGALIVQTVSDKAGLSVVIIGTHFSRESSWSRFTLSEETVPPAIPRTSEADEYSSPD